MPSCGTLPVTSRALLEPRRSVTLAIRAHAPAHLGLFAGRAAESPIESQAGSAWVAAREFLARGL